MAHDRTADDGVRATDGDLFIGDVDLGHAICASGDVAEVTSVALLVGRAAVLLAGRVEVRAGAHAAVGGVAQLSTQMHPNLGGRCQLHVYCAHARDGLKPASPTPAPLFPQNTHTRTNVTLPGECGSRAYPARAR